MDCFLWPRLANIILLSLLPSPSASSASGNTADKVTLKGQKEEVHPSFRVMGCWLFPKIITKSGNPRYIITGKSHSFIGKLEMSHISNNQ